MVLLVGFGLLIVLAAALAGAGALTEVTGRGKRNGWHVLTYRWFGGHCLDGKIRTDATFREPASKVIHPKGRAHRWHWVRGWRRAAVRSGGTLLLLLTGWGLLTARRLTVVLLAVIVAPLAAWVILRGANRARTWRHERHYVRPLRRTLVKRTGLRPIVVTVKRDGDVVRSVAIEWAAEAEIGAETQQAVLSAVTTRLPIEAPDKAWELKGRTRSVVFTQSEPPPSAVSWDDVAALVAGLDHKELAFGLGKRRAPVKKSYSESPHLIIAGGSGGGKSNAAAFLLLQELHRGSLIFNLDPKWISHLWMQNLPNVINAHDAPDLHMALAWLGKELLRRTKAAYWSAGGTGRIRANVGSRIIVVCEELNYGMPGLKEHWREVRTKEDPKRSPALAGLQALSCAGRAADMHEFLMAQMLTVESTGVKDSTIRGNAGIKAMVRWELPGWVAACGKHVPMPAPPTIPGRIQVVTAGKPQETQVPYLHLDDDDEEVAEKAVRWAREYAVSGTVAQIPGGREGIPRELWPPCALGQELAVVDAGQGPGALGQVPPQGPWGPDVITLRDAVDAGYFGPRTLETVRSAAKRDPMFPEPVSTEGVAGFTYDDARLREYAARKAGRSVMPR
jgi:hypothetical protein